MKTIQGPAIFLAQFAGDAAPFNNLENIAAWAAGLGYKGVQIPSWDGRLFDLKHASESKTYCDEVLGTIRLMIWSSTGSPRSRSTETGKPGKTGRLSNCGTRPGPPPTWDSRRTPLFQERWLGPMSIPGRNGPPD